MEALAQNVGEVAGRAAVGGKAIDLARRWSGRSARRPPRSSAPPTRRSCAALDVDAPKVMIDGGS
ncbi:MAG: hypothetical protein HS111_06135 [Kofleriaceae bacterium]|nr:hypothetical protein [Kofleriaceae bacterium]